MNGSLYDLWMMTGCAITGAMLALEGLPPSAELDGMQRVLDGWIAVFLLLWIGIDPWPFSNAVMGVPICYVDELVAAILLCALIWTWPRAPTFRV